jgi:hypothetical protein
MTPIDEADELLRRIHPAHIIMDQKLGAKRPASAAFDNTSGTNRMSVDLRKLLSCVKDCIKDYPNYGIAVFEVALAYELNQTVENSPRSENLAHCDVIGEKPPSVKRKFALRSQLLSP